MTRDQQPFWLAIMILAGGGTLMALRPDTTPAVMQTIGLITGFYYGHRSGSNGTNGNGHSNGNGGVK